MTAEWYPVQKELNVEKIRLLDLDRHILDTELFHVFMREAAWEEARIAPEVLNECKTKKEAAGETLHTDELIRNILEERDLKERESGIIPEKTPDQQLQAVFAWILELCEYDDIRESLFLPGAKEFIDELEESGAFERGESAFLTWGTDPLQLLKLMCLRMNKHPYNITQERAKGTYIADSRNEDGLYVFTTMNGLQISAKTVELYDDKASSFKGLPSEQEGARGFWKLPPNQVPLPSQLGSVPENVKAVNTFPSLRLGSLALHHR